ncbi:flagellar motor switch protein FliM [Planomicrobium sp. CPCC 101110]|uniref:flagellar motor switch protein FliM n=1 Tax=Planomicrobium sp. CPCC 101110 TaxID=2599619 RepID=UPI0011B7BB38|nr:flagellar motor switch protein FliM [Planomicrobium sp. CPCC 101110]TWT27833.1 flagellar motor switch protein FliM [Planomicrobium sp. CPCC 101110]
MADVFSEENINTLLATLAKEEPERDGDGTGRKVHTYDFKKALRFSQDQIRTLTRIHENFARLLTSYLSTQLRTFVQISVDSVEEYAYEAVIQNIEKRSILGVFKAPPLHGNMIMEFSPTVSYVVLDRLLGGQGNITQKTNELTEIEINVIQRVFINALNNFEEAWSSVVKLTSELRELEVNPQFLTMSPPNETVILISLNAKIGDVEGTINICLTHVGLEQVLPKLSARHWLANQKKIIENHEVEALEKKLQGTKLDVTAILGKSVIEIGDFLSLKSGDIIRLNESYTDPVTIMVDDKQKFFAQPGVSKGKIAVQITDVHVEGEEFDDN